MVSPSATSVHKTLPDEGLTKKANFKLVKNPAKPLFEAVSIHLATDYGASVPA